MYYIQYCTLHGIGRKKVVVYSSTVPFSMCTAKWHTAKLAQQSVLQLQKWVAVWTWTWSNSILLHLPLTDCSTTELKTWRRRIVSPMKTSSFVKTKWINYDRSNNHKIIDFQQIYLILVRTGSSYLIPSFQLHSPKRILQPRSMTHTTATRAEVKPAYQTTRMESPRRLLVRWKRTRTHLRGFGGMYYASWMWCFCGNAAYPMSSYHDAI